MRLFLFSLRYAIDSIAVITLFATFLCHAIRLLSPAYAAADADAALLLAVDGAADFYRRH